MAKQTVDALIEGGKATAAPPLGPALGPMGLNIGQVIADINKKTADFKGMQVPVKIIVDSETKEYEISVGTPPASQLLLKEAGVEKGSGTPKTDKIADIRIEQVIKVAKMKQDALMGKTLKDRVKEIIGTCNSMGILVEGVSPTETIGMVNEGKFDAEIKAEKTELTAEEILHLEAEKKRLAEESLKRKAEFEARAKEIMTVMEGKTKGEIKAKMREAKIPDFLISQFVPDEKKASAGAPAKK